MISALQPRGIHDIDEANDVLASMKSDGAVVTVIQPSPFGQVSGLHTREDLTDVSADTTRRNRGHTRSAHPLAQRRAKGIGPMPFHHEAR